MSDEFESTDSLQRRFLSDQLFRSDPRRWLPSPKELIRAATPQRSDFKVIPPYNETIIGKRDLRCFGLQLILERDAAEIYQNYSAYLGKQTAPFERFYNTDFPFFEFAPDVFCVARFENGLIINSDTCKRPQVIYGEICRRFLREKDNLEQALKVFHSPLGLEFQNPGAVKRVVNHEGLNDAESKFKTKGQYKIFGNLISYSYIFSSSYGTFAVLPIDIRGGYVDSTSIVKYYDLHGGIFGQLGFPKSEVLIKDGWYHQIFEGGTINYNETGIRISR